MNHPFFEVAAEAKKHIDAGNTVWQKFTCTGCGSRQTMEEPNKFFTTGQCEECGHVTDIVATGCNYLLLKRLR